MATYRVVQKAHVRMVESRVARRDAQGTLHVLTSAPHPVRFEVGARLIPTPAELAAFPDRFARVED